MLPDRLLVDLDAEPGPRRHLDETVTRLDGIREEGGLVLARGELDGNGPAPGGRHVKRRGQPRSEIEGMGRDGQIGRLGERRDFSELRDAAHLGDAGLQDVAGPPLHDLAKAVQRGFVLAEGNARVGGADHLRQPRVVLGRPHGLLEPEEPVGLEGAGHGDSLARGPRAVHVQHQLDGGAHGLARGFHRGDVRLMELEHPEALGHEVPARRGHVRG